MHKISLVQNYEVMFWLISAILLLQTVDAPTAVNIGFVTLSAVKVLWSGIAVKIAKRRARWFCYI